MRATQMQFFNLLSIDKTKFNTNPHFKPSSLMRDIQVIKINQNFDLFEIHTQTEKDSNAVGIE